MTSVISWCLMKAIYAGAASVLSTHACLLNPVSVSVSVIHSVFCKRDECSSGDQTSNNKCRDVMCGVSWDIRICITCQDCFAHSSIITRRQQVMIEFWSFSRWRFNGDVYEWALRDSFLDLVCSVDVNLFYKCIDNGRLTSLSTIMWLLTDISFFLSLILKWFSFIGCQAYYHPYAVGHVWISGVSPGCHLLSAISSEKGQVTVSPKKS